MSSAALEETPITEDWLREIGFKWHEIHSGKHWLLWLGGAMGLHGGTEDFGVELANNRDEDWFCWLRSDLAHRYHRFIHVRHIVTRGELVKLIEGLTGRDWDPGLIFYGAMVTPPQAIRLRAEAERLDRQILLKDRKWSPIENDDSRGRPLPGHMEVAAGVIPHTFEASGQQRRSNGGEDYEPCRQCGKSPNALVHADTSPQAYWRAVDPTR